jgi:uncharacterized protein
MRRPRPFIFMLCCVFLVPVAVAQKHVDSPVFRSYRPPDELPLIRQPDAVYEMTQAFLVARKASAGDPLAQHELGVRYLWGRGVEADTMRAAYWIAKAAEQNLGSARYNLGILTYNGWGVAWNPFEAYRQFRRCAELGYPEAQYVVAYFFRENLVVAKNDKEALEWMRKSAEGGYDQAREALPEFAAAAGEGIQDTVREGSMVLLPGMSDTTSRMSDKVLLSNALEAAGPELQRALGMASLIDRHSSVDSARLAAVGVAANVGSPEALALLGRVRQDSDKVEAASFYVRALRLESRQAGRLLFRMLEEKEFIAALRTRAAAEDTVADFVWAGLMALGLDMQLMQQQAYVTPQQALGMLERSAAKGYAPALVELGLDLYSGRWTAMNQERAMAQWREAARRGSREAEIRLAITTLREARDSAEVRQALDVVRAGAGAGSLLAELALGFCYEEGVGVKARTATAARYYRTAAARGSSDAFRALLRMLDAVRPAERQFTLQD